MTCEDVERLAEAYADGELALEGTLALEAHVHQCGTCTARLGQIRALKDALQTVPYFRAPEALATRVRTTVANVVAPAPSRSFWRARGWQPWLVSAASLAVVSLALVAVLRQRAASADDVTTEAVIEGHVRSLMGDHLMDIASTDRHTVKPWFAGRVDFSPTVVDLVNDGFPLVGGRLDFAPAVTDFKDRGFSLIGGRLDYVENHPVAAIVYKRREHVINVFVWPQAGGSPSHVTRSDARGYHVISWTRDGVAVWIVSDLALAELDDFARKLDAARHE